MSNPVDTFGKNIRSILGMVDKEDGGALDYYDGAEGFCQEIIKPLDQQAAQDHAFPHELWEKMGEQGFLGVITPEEYGGSGLGYLPLAAVALQISRASPSVGVSHMSHTLLATNQIVAHGTEEQKGRLLPELATGEKVAALAMSEESAGSDVMAMRTKAEQVDGGYKINGGKLWISNGGRFDENGDKVTADVLFLYAKLNGKVTPFILERGMKGFEAVSQIQKHGLKGSETWQLAFDDVFVPQENLVGQEGGGVGVLMQGLDVERLVAAAGVLGAAQAAIDETIAFGVERHQFKQSIIYNQDPAFRLAEMEAEISASLSHLLLTTARVDQGERLDQHTAASVLMFASTAANKAIHECKLIWGGMGHTVDTRIGQLALDAEVWETFAGSREIRKLAGARAIIPGFMHHEKKMSRFVQGGFEAAADGTKRPDANVAAAAKLAAEQ